MDQQIPTPDELSTPAIDALVALRPRAANSKHIELGRYGDVIATWKAQTRPLRARIASEVNATRLPFAGGQELRELAHSEYQVELDETPGVALGSISILRTLDNANPGATNNFTRGVIPSGFKFRKAANPTASPAVLEANYATVTAAVVDDTESSAPSPAATSNVLASFTQPLVGTGVTVNLDTTDLVAGLFVNIPVGGYYEVTSITDGTHAVLTNTGAFGNAVPTTGIPTGQAEISPWTHTQLVTLSLQADRAGEHANAPTFFSESGPTFQASDALFDPTFSVLFGTAAGGFTTIQDATVRRIAGANYLGQFGPTLGALLALMLSKLGAEHVAIVEDTVLAITKVFVADGTWSCSDYFLASLAQAAKDAGVGFGCRFSAFSVGNQRTVVSTTVMLADPKFASDTTEITKAIQKALRSYFDDRPDWYTWRANTIAAVISGADTRILTCVSVAITDASGGSLAEPASTVSVSATQANHYYLADDAVQVTYTNPS